MDVTIPPGISNKEWLAASILLGEANERHQLQMERLFQLHQVETTYEELQLTNQGLQSSNKDMEMMNRALYSANNELQSMNDELRHRTCDLDEAQASLKSLLPGVKVGVGAIAYGYMVTLRNERSEDLWGLRAEEVCARSLQALDIGLPVARPRKPVERPLAGDAKGVSRARTRWGQIIGCHAARIRRRDPNGTAEEVVLLMKEERQ